MRIAQLAPLAERVPPPGYGGSELVVALLTEELVRQGHEVTLFASADSQTRARLVACAPQALRQASEIPQTRWSAYELVALTKMEQMQSDFDIVHNHMGHIALPVLKGLRCPVVSTNHNLVSDYVAPLYLYYRHLPYVAISEAYRRLNHPDDLNYVATVYNGIDISLYEPPADAKRDYLLFLGRVCPEKGTAEAIAIAQAVGLPLKIAGKVDVRDTEYFEEKVRPHIASKQVEYVGEVDLDEKRRFYTHAMAVLSPINFHEPFGLVMAEALAAGAPVLALDKGSVRELIDDGVTGIIGNSIEELIGRFGEVERMDSNECRRQAIERFSKERMAANYLSVYSQILATALV